MVKNSTMGKLRMVKAITGRAIPRIRFLKVYIYLQVKGDNIKYDILIAV
jgi:hypothetical protein